MHFRSTITSRFVKGIASDPSSGYEDPTYLGFRLRFDFTPGGGNRDPSTFLTLDPLFASAEQTGIDSAERYLLAIGMSGRAAALAEFKSQFSTLIKSTPYYIQTVEGVADIWKIPLGEGGDAFNNYRMFGKFLAFETLESIDLRMTAIADLYRKATFDQEYMRDILPENLKHFRCYLDVAEMRSFHRVLSILPPVPGLVLQVPGVSSAVSVADQLTTMTDMDNLISIISFEFEKCVFDFDDAFPVRDAISMQNDPVPASSRFKILPGAMVEKNYYSLLSYILASDDANILIGGSNATGAPKYQAPSFTSTDEDAAFQRRTNSPYFNSNFNGALNAVASIGRDVLNKVQQVVGPAINAEERVYSAIEAVPATLAQFIGEEIYNLPPTPKRGPINENVYK